jgi:hypothetical protein
VRDPLKTLLAAILIATTLACGGADDSASSAAATAEGVEREIAEAVEERTGRRFEPSTDTTPCQILDDALLRPAFDLAADVEITRSPSRHSPHPLCTVSWPKPNAAELEAEQGARMMEYMQKKMAGEDVEMPSFRTTNEVSLTLYEPAFDDGRAARSGFDSAMKRLSDGVTGSHEDVEITFQADLVPVAGVGDDARWAAKMRQLSVVDDRRIFHLTVNTGAEHDAELDTAKGLARQVAEAL